MGYLSFITCAITFYILVLALWATDAIREVKRNRTDHNNESFVATQVFFEEGNATENSGKPEPKNNIAKFDLHHRYGPRSPFSQWSTTRANNQQPPVRVPVSSGNPFDSGNYIVEIKVGSKQVTQHVAFDTGSDLTWIQCQPCKTDNACYNQKDQFYNREDSNSFFYIGCNDRACQSLEDHRCIDGKCTYRVVYADESVTKGYLAKETVYLSPRVGFKKIVIGCTTNNKKMNHLGKEAGIMGLSRGPLSLITQTRNLYNGFFSFCLPSIESHVPGHLTFGDNIPLHAPVKYIQMLTDHDADHPEYYHVNLVGISLDGTLLPIDRKVFANVGTVLDVGASMGWLPKGAYNILRDEFRKKMERYKRAPNYEGMDTCYNLKGVKAVVPSFSLLFDDHNRPGRDVVSITLPEKGYLMPTRLDGDRSQLCLAFGVPNDEDDFSTIGNPQMQTFTVIHDIPGERIGFLPNGCQ